MELQELTMRHRAARRALVTSAVLASVASSVVEHDASGATCMVASTAPTKIDQGLFAPLLAAAALLTRRRSRAAEAGRAVENPSGE